MTNPYASLESYRFWSKSMSSVWHSDVDVVTTSAQIKRSDHISTMGSCFAQHLARFIRTSGLNHLVAEQPPLSMSDADALAQNYGVYSARYGNVYTTAQAVQLFDRAFSRFKPDDDVWRNGNKFVDAFRPQILPGGFDSPEAVLQARETHFVSVREVFCKSDWIVFTLGLTESWRSKIDGSVYPVAPGVAGGQYDPARHEFVNFTSAEVAESLMQFMQRLREVNPSCRVLLTVSPVPLIATYENRHVWVSTTASKAALRVAVDEVSRSYDNLIYFPSYEVITSPAARGRYYQDDLRQVTDVGVSHVMRLFERHFFSAEGQSMPTSLAEHVAIGTAANDGIVCDEELIERALAVAKIV